MNYKILWWSWAENSVVSVYMLLKLRVSQLHLAFVVPIAVLIY